MWGPNDIPMSPQNVDQPLFITDVGLPSPGSRLLAEMMRERRSSLKLLFIKGYAGQAIVKGEFLDGEMDLLPQPFTTDAFAQKIKSILKHRGIGQRSK
jgi:FixJ family two-component response regulator